MMRKKNSSKIDSLTISSTELESDVDADEPNQITTEDQQVSEVL